MDARGDALFPRRYLDQFEKRISELYSCAELARGYAAQTMRQAVALLLDAADAHEQAAAAYELAGSNGHAADFQARAMRHRHAAAARRAAAAAVASRVPDRHDIDSAGSQAAICDGEPLGPPGPLQAGQGYLWVSRGKYPSPPAAGYEVLRAATGRHQASSDRSLAGGVTARGPAVPAATGKRVTTTMTGCGCPGCRRAQPGRSAEQGPHRWVPAGYCHVLDRFGLQPAADAGDVGGRGGALLQAELAEQR